MSEPVAIESANGAADRTRPMRGRTRWAVLLVAGVAVMAAGSLAPLSPLAAPALAVMTMIGCALMLRPTPSPVGVEEPTGEANHSCSLERQVLPVWKRNVEAARTHSDSSMQTLLERFASVSGQLDVALSNSAGASLDLGTTDELMQRHEPEVQRLLGTTLAAVKSRDDVLQTAAALTGELDEMARLARVVQNIGRTTHLLALNAGVEATRAGVHGSGFAVVAQEVRAMAGQVRDAGTQIAARVKVLNERMSHLVAQARRDDTDPDELALQADDNARAVVRALVGSLSEVSRSSRTLRDAGRQIQADIDDILVGLQAQDRLSQMLTSVTEDMGRMEAFMAGGEDEAAHSAVHWLERLDASYTMEEMRSSLHHTTNVDTGTAVEFF